MMRMLRSTQVWCGMVVGSALLSAAIVPGMKNAFGVEKTPTSQAMIARGKYLVHHVAQCIQCHTPRDARGDLIQSQLLTGAPIPIAGPSYAQPWAAESASLAGLGGYEDSFIHYLLTHGHKPDGSKPKSPMPQFQMTDEDAAAVIVYLRSL